MNIVNNIIYLELAHCEHVCVHVKILVIVSEKLLVYIDIHNRFSVNCFSHHNQNTNLQSHVYEELYTMRGMVNAEKTNYVCTLGSGQT